MGSFWVAGKTDLFCFSGASRHTRREPGGRPGANARPHSGHDQRISSILEPHRLVVCRLWVFLPLLPFRRSAVVGTFTFMYLTCSREDVLSFFLYLDFLWSLITQFLRTARGIHVLSLFPLFKVCQVHISCLFSVTLYKNTCSQRFHYLRIHRTKIELRITIFIQPRRLYLQVGREWKEFTA